MAKLMLENDVAWHSVYQTSVRRTVVGCGAVLLLHVGWLLFGSELVQHGFPAPTGLLQQFAFCLVSLVLLAYSLFGVARLLGYAVDLATENDSVSQRCFWCDYDLQSCPPSTARAATGEVVDCPECGAVNWRGRVPRNHRAKLSNGQRITVAKLRRVRWVLLRCVSALQFWKASGSVYAALQVLVTFAFCAGLFYYTFSGALSQRFHISAVLDSPFVNAFVLYICFIIGCLFCFAQVLRYVSLIIRRIYISTQLRK